MAASCSYGGAHNIDGNAAWRKTPPAGHGARKSGERNIVFIARQRLLKQPPASLSAASGGMAACGSEKREKKICIVKRSR